MTLNVFQNAPIKNHDGTVNLVRLLENLPNEQTIQTFNYAWIDPGQQLKEHLHKDCVEYYLFLEGEGRMVLGEEQFAVHKSDFVTVEVGKLHAIVNNGEGKLEFVTLRAMIK